MSPIEIGVFGILVGVIVFLGALVVLDRRDWSRERANLLDRLLSPDFQHYLAAQRVGQTIRPSMVEEPEEGSDGKKKDDGLGMSVT
jgi:hypothetical protein